MLDSVMAASCWGTGCVRMEGGWWWSRCVGGRSFPLLQPDVGRGGRLRLLTPPGVGRLAVLPISWLCRLHPPHPNVTASTVWVMLGRRRGGRLVRACAVVPPVSTTTWFNLGGEMGCDGHFDGIGGGVVSILGGVVASCSYANLTLYALWVKSQDPSPGSDYGGVLTP